MRDEQEFHPRYAKPGAVHQPENAKELSIMYRKVLTMAALTIVVTVLSGATYTGSVASATKRETGNVKAVIILTTTTTRETKITQTLTTLANNTEGENAAGNIAETTPACAATVETVDSATLNTISSNTGPSAEDTGGMTATGDTPGDNGGNATVGVARIANTGLKLLTNLIPSG